MANNTTPIVRCPRCDHPIDSHVGDITGLAPGCRVGLDSAHVAGPCPCNLSPNLIAVGLLFGDLTPLPGSTPRSVIRNTNREWS